MIGGMHPWRAGWKPAVQLERGRLVRSAGGRLRFVVRISDNMRAGVRSAVKYSDVFCFNCG